MENGDDQRPAKRPREDHPAQQPRAFVPPALHPISIDGTDAYSVLI